MDINKLTRLQRLVSWLLLASLFLTIARVFLAMSGLYFITIIADAICGVTLALALVILFFLPNQRRNNQ